LVFTHVSSMKTRRAVFRFAWLSRQAVRAAATSGRACSAAWSVFFYRQVERDDIALWQVAHVHARPAAPRDRRLAPGVQPLEGRREFLD